MPAAEPNKALRLIVPIVVIALAILFVGLMFQPTGSQQQGAATTPAPDQQTSEQADTQGAQPTVDTDTDTDTTDQQQQEEDQPAPPPETTPTPAATPDTVTEAEDDPDTVDTIDASLAGLRAVGYPDADDDPATIGALDDPSTDARDTDMELELHFTLSGAGVESILASHHYKTTAREEHYVIQKRSIQEREGQPSLVMASLATRAVRINGTVVDLFSDTNDNLVWRETAPGSFVCEIVNDAGETVARIEKTYTLTENSYNMDVEQTLINLTDQPMSVKWYQYGPVDLAADISGYRIDTRRIRTGHLLPPSRDASQQLVRGYDELTSLNSVKGDIRDALESRGNWPLVWRGADAEETGPLVWIAQTGRYFAFAIHTDLPPGGPFDDKSFDLVETVKAVPFPPNYGFDRVILQAESSEFTVEPGSTYDASFGAYAGPLGKRELVTGTTTGGGPDPYLAMYESISLDGLIVYNIGGMCAFCTFQWLAKLLLAFLMFAHDTLLADWALSIMLLVLVVRTILHPLYKKSQISLQTFTKQMQRIAPKQKKIQEKYKDEPKKMQAEMSRLMREENVNFRGALGCLPMFLQSPIWIALYAMLYFLFDLRNEPAFFGLFQEITNGQWSFLADLSTPDRFVDFGAPLISIPLMGDIRSINILPLLLGVVFYLHQKYISPPPSASMTEEQQQQQKIMKVIMVVMFPIFMYNAPSGLAIYFITNSTLGILEGRWIRAHIDQLDLDKKVEDMAGQSRKKVPNRAAKNPLMGKSKGKSDAQKPTRKKRR